jgi:hypothetical protein
MQGVTGLLLLSLHAGVLFQQWPCCAEHMLWSSAVTDCVLACLYVEGVWCITSCFPVVEGLSVEGGTRGPSVQSVHVSWALTLQEAVGNQQQLEVELVLHTLGLGFGRWDELTALDRSGTTAAVLLSNCLCVYGCFAYIAAVVPLCCCVFGHQ